MKRKLRIFSNIAIICLSVCMFAFGVYAASTVSVTTSGTVTFSATDVYAEVTRTITGAKNTPQTGNAVTIDTSANDNDNFPMNADLEFETANSLVEIKFTILNKASAEEVGRNIYVTVTEGNTVGNECTNVLKSVEHLGAEFVISPNTSRSFSIYLSVNDVNKSATANYDYVVTLKNTSAGTVLTAETATFTLNTDQYTVSNVTSTAAHITVPETYNDKPVTKIGDTAFFGVMSTIQKVTLPNTITEISSSAFQGCNNTLIACVLPENISEEALIAINYTAVKNIVIPSGIENVPSDCFYGMNIDSITIPASVKTFGKNSFYMSSASSTYRQVIYKGTLENWLDISFYEDAETPSEEANPCNSYNLSLLFINGIKITELELEGESIPFACFPEVASLNKVVIKSGCTEIGAYAFSGSGLSSITIPTSVTKIGKDALRAGYTIHYLGTKADWNKIEFGQDATYGCNIICSDGVIED